MTDLSVIGTPCARVDETAALEDEEEGAGTGGTVPTVPLAAPPSGLRILTWALKVHFQVRRSKPAKELTQ